MTCREWDETWSQCRLLSLKSNRRGRGGILSAGESRLRLEASSCILDRCCTGPLGGPREQRHANLGSRELLLLNAASTRAPCRPRHGRAMYEGDSWTRSDGQVRRRSVRDRSRKNFRKVGVRGRWRGRSTVRRSGTASVPEELAMTKRMAGNGVLDARRAATARGDSACPEGQRA